MINLLPLRFLFHEKPILAFCLKQVVLRAEQVLPSGTIGEGKLWCANLSVENKDYRKK